MTSAALHTQSLVIQANEGYVFVFAYEIQYTVLFLCAFYVFPVSWQYIHKTIYGLWRGTLHSVCIVIASECFEWMPEDICPSLTVPRLYQTTAICSLSLSFPFIHEACWNKHFAKTMLSYLTLNLMQPESPPSHAVLSFTNPRVKSVGLVTVPHFCFSSLCHIWHIMTITINRGSVKKWNVIAMVAHLIFLCASCIRWLSSLTCIDYYAYC